MVRTNSIVTGMRASDGGDDGGYPYLGPGFDERDMPLEALFALVDKYRCHMYYSYVQGSRLHSTRFAAATNYL